MFEDEVDIDLSEELSKTITHDRFTKLSYQNAKRLAEALDARFERVDDLLEDLNCLVSEAISHLPPLITEQCHHPDYQKPKKRPDLSRDLKDYFKTVALERLAWTLANRAQSVHQDELEEQFLEDDLEDLLAEEALDMGSF